MDLTFSLPRWNLIKKKIAVTIELSTKKKWPIVIVCWGARVVYEGMLSLDADGQDKRRAGVA